ncbi:SRPBCC family protein [Streptomyces sp. NBC_00775]|uniref:SRPBCC family protein n=1 Tax=unclassified Streptomyces TaxID=2593676 RepID=UPI0030E1601B|nr:hypothetical protein OIC96_44085 [Streptomyces sp. NBC_00775]WUB33373.1 hypothetical protein OHA51_05640 [Streptomyces sp. NBC_00589]
MKHWGSGPPRSHIVEYEPPRRFAWAVENPQHPTAIWRFTLEPQDGGTLVREWMQMGPARSGLSFAIDRMPEKEQKIPRPEGCGSARGHDVRGEVALALRDRAERGAAP